MNDDVRFEPLFADGLHELAPQRAPDRLRTKVKTETGETRPRARWLALIKEPPMRTNSRLAAGSPTARAAAIMVATLLATLLVVGAGIAGARLLAAGGPIIVDQSGGGTVETITEAVAMVEDGDEILVRPGTYAEGIEIDKDITLRGDGPVDEVVIELAEGVLVTLNDTDAVIADLTLRGGELTQGMQVMGGAPTISGVVFDSTGRPYGVFGGGIGGGSLDVLGGSAHALGNQFLGGGEIRITLDANATFEGNELSDGPHLYLQDPGDEAVVRGNTISGTFDRAMGLFGPSTMTIENNAIDGASGDGISIGWGSSSGHDPIVRGNEILGSTTGINVATEAAPVVSGNRIRDNTTGILSVSSQSVLRDNELEGNTTGIALSDDAVLEGNTIRGGGTGLALLSRASNPTLSGNTICDNKVNVRPPRSAEMPVFDEGNTICKDAPAE